ncbi:MAG: acetyl-CoA carboxylase carboxyltransferase subunit beta [Planctomycetota bacterium]|nr:MAG: acetyl-CoA carboxylase carboxyltransferase subunit beta [Planctomycetota bacterium]
MAWRRKKKDMPSGLWSRCPGCGATVFNKELEANMRVCPKCGYHHTLAGRRRIELTADPGSFVEKFTELRPTDRLGFVDTIPYAEKIQKAQSKTGNADACLAGLATIEGKEVVLAVLDFSFMGGSMGEVVGEKVARSTELAQEKGLPLIIFSASGGARMHEGAVSLMQMAKTCGALHQLRQDGGFTLSVMTNPTTGGVTASFASVCDILVGEPGSLIGFAGPRVIQNTIRQELPKGFQRAEFLLEKGQIDLIVERSKMRETLSRILSFAPQYA